MNTSLFRVMLVSISLCWLLFAKTHIDDQVDPNAEAKIAIESQLQGEVETKVAVEETIIPINVIDISGGGVYSEPGGGIY